MTINANTKIAAILKQNPKALDAIISISPKFEKLRNPLLRKVMAGRTTLAAASKAGGCTVEDFFKMLEPIGFEIDSSTKPLEEIKKPFPIFIKSLTKENLVELDVRPIIASGSDPFQMIMEKVKALQQEQVLKIVNTFEPAPLILLLQKNGFEVFVDTINGNLIETYFYKPVEMKPKTNQEAAEQSISSGFEDVMHRFGDKLQTIDVRHLEMPQPMLTILEALEHLASNTALYVFHKRIPVFLLPELSQKGFEYRIKETSDGEVHLLIF